MKNRFLLDYGSGSYVDRGSPTLAALVSNVSACVSALLGAVHD